MDLLPALLSILVLVATLFLGSLITKLLKAKRYRFYWMFLTLLLTFVAVVTANLFQLDGAYALGIGLLVFLLSLRIVNGLSLAASVTTLVASLSVLGLLFIGQLVLLQQLGSNPRETVDTALRFVPDSEFYNVSVLEKVEDKDSDLFEMEDEEVSYSEADLLPDRVEEKPVLQSRVYQPVNPHKAGKMTGAMIRLLKMDGKLVKGNIVGIQGNHLIIGKYIPGKGVIRAPVSFASIKKLEVLR